MSVNGSEMDFSEFPLLTGGVWSYSRVGHVSSGTSLDSSSRVRATDQYENVYNKTTEERTTVTDNETIYHLKTQAINVYRDKNFYCITVAIVVNCCKFIENL